MFYVRFGRGFHIFILMKQQPKGMNEKPKPKYKLHYFHDDWVDFGSDRAI